MYPHLHNVLIQRGQHMPRYFDVLIDPYDDEKTIAEAEAEFPKITLPTYTGAGWYGYTYKTHLAGAQTYFSKIPTLKKMVLTGPAHPDRPLRALRGEMLRWYDHWLKGIDTGIMHGAASHLLGDGRECSGGTVATGRCRRRNGPSFISPAGSG